MPSQRCRQTIYSYADMVRPKTGLGIALIHEPAKGPEIVFSRALSRRLAEALICDCKEESRMT